MFKKHRVQRFFSNIRSTGQSQKSLSASANGSRMWTLPEPPAARSQAMEAPVDLAESK